ncbi:hypothetical protein BU15DRAFT_67857 [Melanogaster broomeanus]|nr:hypothetical protein BU15DRAFT_67857 [Melanogaster broomeanus]
MQSAPCRCLILVLLLVFLLVLVLSPVLPAAFTFPVANDLAVITVGLAGDGRFTQAAAGQLGCLVRGGWSAGLRGVYAVFILDASFDLSRAVVVREAREYGFHFSDIQSQWSQHIAGGLCRKLLTRLTYVLLGPREVDIVFIAMVGTGVVMTGEVHCKLWRELALDGALKSQVVSSVGEVARGVNSAGHSLPMALSRVDSKETGGKDECRETRVVTMALPQAKNRKSSTSWSSPRWGTQLVQTTPLTICYRSHQLLDNPQAQPSQPSNISPRCAAHIGAKYSKCWTGWA